MYNKTTDNRRGRPLRQAQGRSWQTMLLAALFAWLLPQWAHAEAYVEKSDNYSVSLGGSNIVYFTAPVYDQDNADQWITSGKLMCQPEGESQFEVIYWKAAETDISSSATEVSTYFSTSADGFFDITKGNTRESFRLTKDNAGNAKIKRNSDGITFSYEAEWAVPYNLLGKKLTFTWEVKRDGNSWSEITVSGLKTATINMPAAASKLQPFISQPMLNPNNPGKLEVPWFMTSDSIVSARYEYTDANGERKKVPISNMASGIIELDANVPHRSFRVVCSYKQRGDKGSYLIEDQGSSAQNIAMIHAPIGLTARSLGGQKAKVELTWSVPYIDDEDLAPTDFFEVQRSLTGKEADFETIYQDFFSSKEKKATYTFIDSTLVESMQAGILANGGTLDNLTYRVRRAITQDWGWGTSNNCAATTRCVVDNLHLLRIKDYSAQWEDSLSYTARVSWQYADEHGAVWDDRAKMMLRVIMKNREGAIVDSLTYTLDETERAQRYKVVNVTRSCIYYDIDMYVERGTSPINDLADVTEFYFPIRSDADWATFSQKVEAAKGEYDVNARLYADITTDWRVGRSESAYYRGKFDGNGHTLTFNRTDTELYSAPFRYVGNATIKNLHVAGTISTSGRHAAGLIGDVRPNSTVFIENCRTSVAINSSVNGNATNGGFIAIVNTGANVTFRNCKFDGAFEGANCSHNGGFVGYTNGAVIVDNCLFAPERISTKSDGCQTWARVGTGSLTIINSYATREYSAFIAIRNANDWKAFQTMVENAKNQYLVDARLEADITTSEYVGGGEAATFRGTFDGNGHTITFNKSGFSEEHIAPFRYVGGTTTIRNLHTAGTIKTSQKYAAGLISEILTGSTVNIENCRSSMTINSSVNGDATNGGFVGGMGGTLTIRNSKFDGSFEGANSSHNGGFAGYIGNNSLTIENCLFAPDHISTKFEGCETWARKADGTVTVTNSEAITHYSPSSIIIRSEDDWDKFGQLVKESNNTYWVDAILQADISVKKSVGFSDAPWRGTLHGNGHTITIDIESGNNNSAALFPQVYSVTITDLHVKGKVNGGIHSAGLIGGAISGDPTITLNHVWVSTEVNCSSTHAGGIIGHSANANVNMNDVLFDGKVNTNNADNSYIGCIIGWSGSGGRWNINRVYSHPSARPEAKIIWFCVYYNGNALPWGTNDRSFTITSTEWGDWGVNHYNKTNQSEVVSLMNGKEAGTWQLVNGNAVPVMQTTEKYLTAAQLVETLGKDNWTVVGGKAVPKMESATVDSKTSLDDLLAKLVGSWVKEGETINPKTTTIDDTQYTSGTIFIRSIDDWGKFYQMVEEAKGQRDVNAVLMTDINAGSVMIGQTEGTAYRGTFDGNGHTVTFNMVSQSTEAIAPFHMVSDATIKNLHMVGSIESSKKFASGLIGQIVENATVDIENCHSSITIKSHVNGDATNGGFIGLSNGNVIISNCLFDGSFEGADCYSNGGFVGWTYKPISIKNCLFAPGHISTKLDQCKTWGRTNASSLYRINNCYATQKYSNDNDATLVGSMPASELAAKLGSENWQVADNKVIPVFESSIPNFYHKNTGTIDQTLLTQTRQSSVVLTWNTDGKPVDYFRVLRRVEGQGEDKWEEVATNLTDMSYEDTSVSPLLTYEYKVEAVNDCEGRTATETKATVGECKHTGRVEGYVRFNDGTGAPGIGVIVTYNNNTVATAETDESGYFEVEELSYQGGTTVEYSVGPAAESGIHIEPVAVTFDAKSNNQTLREFTIENGRRFSGYVMYDGTSIPVKGVNFLVDGNRIHNAQGKYVETDYDGSFSFRVLDGQHTIQAVMDKHVFTNEGWYKNSNKQNINADIAGIYFYDATKVTLTGRVVGGDDQGQKPLMNNLSQNNLGDSIQIVLTLEGDNTSWLVYDNLNPNRSQREEVVSHPRGGDKHYTSVLTQRKRMVVTPDLTTGEYTLKLPPVRWKVQQVYCKGYATLFQEGQVSEVIDLTNALDTVKVSYDGTYYDVDENRVENLTAQYHAIYNRIYHSPVEVTYRQIGYDNFDYFGDKSYMATELTGKATEVPLVYSVRKPNWPQNRKDSLMAVYTLGHPVFSIERRYKIQLQVGERYLYNNDPVGRVDMVPLKGGMAYMQNGMRGLSMDDPTTIKDEQELDSLGRCVFTLKADQTSNMSNCLRTVTFTVERDGTYFEAEPLQAYVLNMYPIGSAKSILTEGQPLLFDILRDPPGAYSSNTLAKGATLNNTYMMNLTLMAGLNMTYKSGEDLQVLSGQLVGTSAAGAMTGTVVGPISTGKFEEGSVDQLMYNAQGSKAFSHTMVLNNAVSTSGDPSMVGADADVYIGTVQNVVVTPMSTIRAVTHDMLKQMIARLGKDNIKLLSGTDVNSELEKYVSYGTVAVIASGLNADGDTIHLIRDVALGYGPEVQSQFFYSQKQILTQIIPDKAKEIADMMFCGTKDEAQAIANSTKKPVYLSLRLPTDSAFAVVNKPIDGHAYNTSIATPQEGINYLVVLPEGKEEKDFSDEVTEKYQIIKAWLEMIAQNEGEKLTARDLVANYDVAGTQGVNYSETFDNNYSTTWMNYFPIATEVDYFGTGSKELNQITSGVTLGITLAASIALSMQEMKTWSDPTVVVSQENGTNQSVSFSGHLLQWKILPVIVCSTVGTDAETRAYNRTESFTIATDPASHLNVDVYRVKTQVNEDEEFVSAKDVFTNYNFNTLNNDMEYYIGKTLKKQDILSPRSFVFRTRGGSTQNPWEDQRVTKVYNPGTVLDARTLKIVNPKIRLDKQSVSGVAIDDAAKFTVYVGNDSEKPEATDGITILQVFVPDQMNPQGAKISINGQTLTTGGMTVTCVPGTETALQMEVRAGQGFDYEGLVIGVMSPTDPEHTWALTPFDVHFLREAGGLAIATPGDKWVLNTNAQMDGKRGWYIPVTINGFDRHQHNFDHIEFQYKESQRGDDSWTNLCSFYTDAELMAKANGVRKLLKDNENITTEFYGEGWTMERAYDLRAVLFCRNGNDFLTTSSKVISGIKDTRRPQLFGTPEPKSGLLTAGDDIVFNFSEDIEYNYLSAITNFEVKGEVNNNSLSEMVSVQFDGATASVETEAKRNFSGKDLTIDLMVKPTETGRDMPLFSHGTNGQNLQLWLTSDFKLKAVVNNDTLTASKEMPKNIFQQVALVLNQTDSLVTLYHGGVEVGRQKLSSLYTGTGTLIFGRAKEQDSNKSQYYEGRMMEARLWYNAMDGTLIGSTYGNHRLTGFEKDLVDYYPMNEGSGDYVTDHTQGANAQLINASWAIPQGLSLHVDKADKGVLLDKNAMNRTAEQDYTLMFWFKTDKDGSGTLLSNGRGLREDNGSENQFHIGFEADTLKYRSNGFVADVPGNWSDGKWHHYAMTVNRGRSVANIYMDKTLVTTFETDSLGGISGGYPLIGASRYDIVNEKDTLLRQDGLTPLKGNVDELLFFAQTLPEQLISTYASKSPNGDEAGLLTYLSFDRQERQKDNSIELVPYAYSKKLYLDDQGKPRYQLDPETKQPTDTLVRDYLFVDDEDVVLAHFDKKNAAPVVPYEEVTNLKFSFIGRGNQVLVELDEPNAKLNHRNLYVTLRDIEDLNGNTMASPQTACYYVTNSSMQWMVNRLDVTIKYGSGEGCELPFLNNGAQSHTYTIENCPRWLTLNKYSGVVAPQALDYVTATASKDLNIGTYNEILYLTDEEGISEPFYLNLTVEGETPDWAGNVDSELLANSMSISGQVYLYGELDTDARDIVGVFDDQNVCHGFANITHDVQSTETGLYLTVYDSQSSGRELSFRLWQYSTGREIVLTPKDSIKFQKDAMLGATTPVRFDGGEAFVQNFKLQEGWNWVSFNLNSPQLTDVNNLLKDMPWSDGDILTDLSTDTTLTYKNEKWIATGSTKGMAISPKKAYAIKVQKSCNFPIGGTVVKADTARTVQLKHGWNAIGYTPIANLAVETALSDYYDYAQPGDVIKSHTEFAYFTKTGNTGRWRGSLHYMKPGEGYMMLRTGATTESFTYPFYDLNSNYREDWTASASRSAAARGSYTEEPRNAVRQWRNTMSVSAVVEGFALEEGDRLVAYTNGQLVGATEAYGTNESDESTEPFYLTIGGDKQAYVGFAIERDGKIVAASAEPINFHANGVLGTPDDPFTINLSSDPTGIRFVTGEYEEGKWYTVDGVQQPTRPIKKGVYIFNGRKVVIK